MSGTTTTGDGAGTTAATGATAGATAGAAAGTVLATATAATTGTGETGAGAAAGTTDARAWLPEEYRADPAFASFNDVGSLAKSFRDTQAFVGADKAQLLKLPKDEADAAAWGEVFTKLGRPEKPDGYKFEAPEGAVPPEVLGGFAEAAHGAGLSQKQAAQVLGYYTTTLEAQAVAQTQAATQALRTEWGNAFPDKVHNLTRLLTQAGGQEALDAFNAIGGGRNLVLLKALSKLADQAAEPGTLKGGSGGGMGAAMTPAQATQQLAAKKLDPEFMKAYQNADHAGHGAAVQEMAALYAQAHPGG